MAISIKQALLEKTISQYPSAQAAWLEVQAARAEARQRLGPRGYGRPDRLAAAEADWSAAVDTIISKLVA